MVALRIGTAGLAFLEQAYTSSTPPAMAMESNSRLESSLRHGQPGLCSGERLKAGFGLTEAGEAEVAAEDGHGFKERRRVLASADGHPDGLKHGTGLEAERLGRLAQGLL